MGLFSSKVSAVAGVEDAGVHSGAVVQPEAAQKQAQGQARASLGAARPGHALRAPSAPHAPSVTRVERKRQVRSHSLHQPSKARTRGGPGSTDSEVGADAASTSLLLQVLFEALVLFWPFVAFNLGRYAHIVELELPRDLVEVHNLLVFGHLSISVFLCMMALGAVVSAYRRRPPGVLMLCACYLAPWPGVLFECSFMVWLLLVSTLVMYHVSQERTRLEGAPSSPLASACLCLLCGLVGGRVLPMWARVLGCAVPVIVHENIHVEWTEAVYRAVRLRKKLLREADSRHRRRNRSQNSGRASLGLISEDVNLPQPSPSSASASSRSRLAPSSRRHRAGAEGGIGGGEDAHGDGGYCDYAELDPAEDGEGEEYNMLPLSSSSGHRLPHHERNESHSSRSHRHDHRHRHTRRRGGSRSDASSSSSSSSIGGKLRSMHGTATPLLRPVYEGLRSVGVRNEPFLKAVVYGIVAANLLDVVITSLGHSLGLWLEDDTIWRQLARRAAYTAAYVCIGVAFRRGYTVKYEVTWAISIALVASYGLYA